MAPCPCVSDFFGAEDRGDNGFLIFAAGLRLYHHEPTRRCGCTRGHAGVGSGAPLRSLFLRGGAGGLLDLAKKVNKQSPTRRFDFSARVSQTAGPKVSSVDSAGPDLPRVLNFINAV
jgi:hypothetical protein